MIISWTFTHAKFGYSVFSLGMWTPSPVKGQDPWKQSEWNQKDYWGKYLWTDEMLVWSERPKEW